MSHTAVVVVCLPKATPIDRLASTATAHLASTRMPSHGPAGHFRSSTRLHTRSLVQPWRGTTAGGPVRLLNLDAMRTTALQVFWHRWHIWQRVTDGTKPAQPYWHFLERHQSERAKYSLAKARQHYLAQPRIATMRTYNALPNKVMALSTDQLEAFQTGPDAYAHLGLLSAVPGDGMITLHGEFLTPASGRLADQLSYLDATQRQLQTLDSRDRLVAITTTRK